MRTETDPVTGMQAGAAALGAEERSDEAPRAEDKQERSAPDPEVVAKPTRRQFTAEYRLRIAPRRRTDVRARARSGVCFAARVCTPRICRLGARRAEAARFRV